MSNQPFTRELLDVEDDDARQQRIRTILENTDAAAAATRPRPFPTLPPSRPYSMPSSDLISRAEAFLPRLAASNADLARRAALDPTSVDIEHLGENSEGSHIEMNLGLGVFEQRPRPRPRPGHGSDHRRKNENEQPSDYMSESSSDSEDSESGEDDNANSEDSEDSKDSEDSEDSEESEDIPHATETVKKPGILVLSSDAIADGG